MTAVVPPSSSSSSTSPPPLVSAPTPSSQQPANPSHPALPPLVTSPAPPPTPRWTNLSRPMSHASKNRLSQYSTGSAPPRSRPASHVFAVYPSSLPYTLVRDFAYPASHPLHYGSPPEPSRPPSDLGMNPSIDAQSQRRLSDPPVFWESRTEWDGGSWAASDSFHRAPDIPPIYLADGPPWSEDEDLQSPVVSSRHRKHKSASGAYGHSRSRSGRDARGGQEGSGASGAGYGAGGGLGPDNGRGSNGNSAVLNPDNFDRERGYYVGTSGDGSERYYVNQAGDEANGPGGEYVTYPPDDARNSMQAYQLRPPVNYGAYQPGSDASSPISSPDFRDDDQSRYSRDYQFTITSPDEEMHGKAVALFDFERENENELPLVEGQIIWVSYRHGQGWLVAMDPKTQESGLVPEEYVRLLRDIEGGMTSLTGQGGVVVDGGSASASGGGVGSSGAAAGDGSSGASGGAGGGSGASGGGAGSPNDGGGTPTQAEHQQAGGSTFVAGHTPTPSSVANGYHQPIVSTFSTSSKDLDPYPQHLLGTQAGQTPPQVVHYHGQRGGGSQANTPTLLSHQDAGPLRRSSQDVPAKKGDATHVASSLASVADELAEAKHKAAAT